MDKTFLFVFAVKLKGGKNVGRNQPTNQPKTSPKSGKNQSK